MMRSYELHPQLESNIQLIWSMELDEAAIAGAPEHVVPDGIVEVVFHYGTPFAMRRPGEPFSSQAQSFAVSQTRRFLEMKPIGPSGFVSIRFFPWGVRPYIDVPVESFADDAVAVRHLWGRAGEELEERMRAAPSVAERVAIVQAFLVDRQRRGSTATDEPLIRAVVDRRGRVRVRDLAAELGFSERQLERRFRNTVGVPPKHFARICRFLETCRLLSAPGTTTVAEVALAAGYADQAHLHHEFVSFSGLTPAAFGRARGVCFLDLD